MRIKYDEKEKTFSIVQWDKEEKYIIRKGQNGKKYCDKKSVGCDVLNVSEENEKIGKVMNLNLPIEYTCNHTCECYKNGVCYASGGCYNYSSNQKRYTENFNFFVEHGTETFIKAIQFAIESINYKHFRWFTCGDIPTLTFLNCMVTIAKNNPNIAFWSYTKKYGIVNKWIEINGNLPENLKIIFSHWLNENGTYFPMENPYNLPTSEFIPFGHEELAKKVTFICPCSDPTKKVQCVNCEHPCYKLEHGQSQALLEHSTKRTKARDKAIKEAKKNLK